MSEQRAYSSDAFNGLPFREQLDALYGISARDRRDLILAAPNAQRLVRSFAAESLFHTLKEVGLEDGVELLALASGEQLCALVDLDCWKKDRLEIRTLLDWLEVIVEAGGRAVGELLNSIDRDLLVLLLKRFVRVHRRDDPEEPEDDVEGPEIFELDEHYQIIFHRWDARSPLVRSLIEALYERDYSYFVTVMEETWWGVDSDLEEASFRLRSARLQDRGFPDYFEAQQIYRPLRASDLAERLGHLARAAQSRETDGRRARSASVRGRPLVPRYALPRSARRAAAHEAAVLCRDRAAGRDPLSGVRHARRPLARSGRSRRFRLARRDLSPAARPIADAACRVASGRCRRFPHQRGDPHGVCALRARTNAEPRAPRRRRSLRAPCGDAGSDHGPPEGGRSRALLRGECRPPRLSRLQSSSLRRRVPLGLGRPAARSSLRDLLDDPAGEKGSGVFSGRISLLV